MPKVNVSLKDGAPVEELEKAKKQVTDSGGKIVSEFTLIKGFLAEFPSDAAKTLESNAHLDVETDQTVHTQ